MLHAIDWADRLNTVEFVPFIIGILYLIMAATGLFISVGWVAYLLIF